MKKFLAALLSILILVSLCACGIDYEKLGYDKAQEAIDSIKESDDYESTIESFKVACDFFGKDYVKDLLTESVNQSLADELAKKDLKLSEEDTEALSNGINRCLDEFVDSIAK